MLLKSFPFYIKRFNLDIMSTDNISKIKDRLDVVDVISGYLKLQKSGVNFKACCPFHNEKTPSFYISPERQIWHCFGCSKGGDIFGFVKEIEGVEFPEALRILAQRAGVEIDQYDPAVKNEKNQLYKILETTARFFEKQLWSSEYGNKALKYLTDRGLKEDIIKEFRLGYAPNDWYSLSRFLSDCGYSDKEIVDAGLAFKKEGRDSVFDRFRSRIIFPIFDLNGSVAGYTGRIFGDAAKQKDIAKYINTPQTQIYDKSRILFGLNKAKTEIRTKNDCILVEGNMDMLMSYQAGVKNVIASSGTALTPSHLRLLQRYTNNLSFCFDTDQAGAMATKRGIGIALSQNFNIRVISMDDKECKDPADYVQKYGEKWNEVASAAKPVIDFYFEKAKRENDPHSAEGKKSVIIELAPFIKRLASQVERSHWVSQLAFFLRVPEDAVKSDISSVKDDLDNHTDPVVNNPVSEPKLAVRNTLDMLNETLLSVIIKNPSIFKDDLGDIPEGVHLFVKKVAERINGNDGDRDISKIIKTFASEEAMSLEFAYLRSQELWKDFKDEELKEEFKNLIGKIKRKTISAKLAGIEFDIKEAESQKDSVKINDLVSRFNVLTEELSRLQKSII